MGTVKYLRGSKAAG